MKRSLTIALCITAVTAAIGIVLWLNGYPPEKEGLSDLAAQIRAFATLPLFWAGLGLAGSGAMIWLKREKLAEPAGKAGRIPAIAVQLPAILGLLAQIVLPLDLYEMIGSAGSHTVFFYFIAAIFMVMGNYIATAPFGSRIGFRTAATLSDQIVWTKTHRFLGRNLVFLAIITLPLPWLMDAQIAQWVLIALVVCLKATSWLHARRLSAQQKLRRAATN